MARRLQPSQQSEVDVSGGDRGGPHREIQSKKKKKKRKKVGRGEEKRKDVVWMTEKGWREKR